MARQAEHYCRLTSLYLEACGGGAAPARPDLAARMRRAGQEIARTGDAALRRAYARHARLLSLVLKDPRFGDEVALPDLLGPLTETGRPGLSVVSCSMNRTDNLLRALPSWLGHEAVSEVVIVDWSSDEPVRDALSAQGVEDARIRIVRVNGAPRWILSQAFNAGFRAASFDTILKLDADIVLSEDFFSRNGQPASDGFIAGNWRNVSADQAHVNGFFLATRAALAAVGGFNEFITTYGWDDEDLYARLEAEGIRREDVLPDTIHHLPHSDEERTGEGADDRRPAREAIMASPRFMIERNRVLVEKMPVWTAEMELLPLQIDERLPDGLTLSVVERPAGTVPQDVFDAASEETLREMMVWDYGPELRDVPSAAFARVMARRVSELSKEAFLEEAAAARDHPAPAVSPARLRLFIDAQHGLGNRLRAIGSAAAIAAATDRELVIVWQPDDHCDCRLSDLFDYDGAVIERAFLGDAGACDIHNYMAVEGGEKDAPVRADSTRDIYARSAFVLNSPHSTWERQNRFIRALRPVEAVRELVSSVRHPNDISAHVRMVGGRKDEHLPYESTDNWSSEDHDLIDHWRTKSHFSHFLKRIDALIAEGRADRIFVAADMPETYDAFRRCYGDRLAWLPRALYDRSAEQLQYALADAMLLGRAPRLLGSTWSSFSELAVRLAPGPVAQEMSGKDF